uniref:CUB domain-containing protein n=1 Tax=Rhodnius prolixus TaxID=13249 RepID=T1H970_RHOPR
MGEFYPQVTHVYTCIMLYQKYTAVVKIKVLVQLKSMETVFGLLRCATWVTKGMLSVHNRAVIHATCPSSEEEFLCSAATKWYILKKKRLRKYHVHPINKKRSTLGEFHHLYKELRNYPDRFFEYVRMGPPTFDYILEKIRSKLSKLWKNCHGNPITIEEKLVITLRVWDQCNVVQDYLTVYDGGSTTDPVLVRLCGGDAVPDIVSSGNNMLLEFHTSPYDNPFHPVPLSFLPGFELEVQVLFVDSRSHHYVRDVHHCEILLTSFDSAWGILENPRHSLPPNTTCRYHFQGRKHETVWVSFIKYHAAPADPAAYQLTAECNARLRIWDGRITSLPGQQMNVSLLGEFCKDEVPRLCDHTLLSNSSRFTRPCSPSESYVSSGSELTLEQTLKQGSVLFPLDFMVRYEFVDTLLEGVHVKGSANPCDRVFTSSVTSPSGGKFQSPKSVFYYGRGGAHNLSCILRFEPTLGERVQLTLTKATFGGRACSTQQDARTGRWRCVHSYSPNVTGIAELWISEYPWPGVQLPRDCLCSNLSDLLVITTLTSSSVEVNFTVTLMNITQDFNHFNFEGEYQFISTFSEEDVENCIKYKKGRRLRGSSGDIALKSPRTRKNDDVNEIIAEKLSINGVFDNLNVGCDQHPWLIEPDDNTNNFLYLKVRGYELPSNRWKSDMFQCQTSNRIIVYSGIETRDPKVVCPQEGPPVNTHRVVEVFSDGWNHSTSISILNPNTRSFVVEFLEQEPGSYSVSWMEVSKRPLLTATSSFVMSSTTIDCPYRCPELNACISSALWCDGAKHCPSGFDEEETNCAFQFGVPVLYVAIGGGALIVLTLLIAVTACFKCRQARKNRRKKNCRSPNPGLSGSRYPPNPEDLYMDVPGNLSLGFESIGSAAILPKENFWKLNKRPLSRSDLG